MTIEPPSDDDLAARLSQLSPERRALIERLRKRTSAVPAATAGDAIARVVPEGDDAPLSFTQEMLWLFERAGPNVAMYNSPRVFRLRGDLRVDALQRALDAHVERHHVYRAVIAERASGPRQRVQPARPVVLHRVDLRPELAGLDAQARTQHVNDRLRALAREPFDLERDQLLRGALFTVGEREWMLLLVSHHIASDDWSRGVMVREIEASYAAALDGRDAAFAPLPIQYADYSHWQREHLAGARLERILDYWRAELADAPAVLELPADRPRLDARAGQGARMLAAWPAELANKLRALATAHDATLFMCLLAAWQVFLARVSGQTDIMVGTPIAGRERPELEDLVGYFSDTLVIRGRLEGGPTFVEHLARVRASCLRAFEHRDVPYEKLVLSLAGERGGSVASVFHSLFTVHTDATEQVSLPGLQVESMILDAGIAKTDFSLAIRPDKGGGLRAMIEYRTDLFDESRVARMHDQLRTLIEGIVADPNVSVTRLPLLSAAARAELDGFQGERRPYSDRATLAERIEACVDRNPSGIALQLGESTLTFASLETRANQLAHRLRAAGVGPGVGVALCFDRSFELVIGMVAALKAGGHYIPLDPSYPYDRIAYMAADSGATVVLTDAAHLGHLPVDGTAHTWLLDDAWQPNGMLAAEPATRAPVRAAPDDLAYVIYTSGSTGRPKGVMIPNRAVVHYVEWMERATSVGPRDCVLQKAPASFDACIWEFFLPLVTGARLLLARPGGHQDPDYLLRTISHDGVTVMQLVPSQLQMLLETKGAEALAALRLLVCGGEALPGDLLARLDRVAPVSMVNLYGPTEATVYATEWAHDARIDGAWPGSPVPIGRPISNLRVHIVDAAMELLPVGVPGELLIGGVALARGYHGRPELTAEKFIRDPFSPDPNDRLYRTGDLARRRPDGVLEYLGRIDNQVKVRGFRIELGEIEEALGRHPSVQHCVVVVREDAPGDRRLVAYVALEAGVRPLTTVAVREFLLATLPTYMVPASVMTLPAIPMNANGKVDRHALPAPEPEAATVHVAPRTPTEAKVAAIWAEIFGVPSVSVDDGFLDIGGHSLLAIRILGRVRRDLDVHVPLATLLRGDTVAQMAKIADELLVAPKTEDDDLALVPVARETFRRGRSESSRDNT